MILEERKGLEDDEEEELSGYEDHIFINSESDSEYEEEDKIDHQPASKDPVTSQSQHQQASQQWQQEKTAMCLGPRWTGDTLYMHQEQEKHMQNTQCPSCCIGWHEKAMC